MPAVGNANDREAAKDARDRLRSIIRRESLKENAEFKLSSGRSSQFFFDMKKTMFDPEGVTLLADILFQMIRDDPVEYVGGLETGAIPIVTAVCYRSHVEKPIKSFFVRKEPKGHGTNKLIDGQFSPNSRVILFEDVTTTGGSAMKAVEAVREQGCSILKVVTVVDRLEGAIDTFDRAGLKFEAVFNRHDFE
jgi:orotate phosphoribosyltransferase